MHWRCAAALLLGASTYVQQAAAQVITITQYPSTCSAIYTSGSRSVTVVQSTVTVSPVPWNDDIANGGTAFVLQALPDNTGPSAGAPRWVLPNGYLTTDGSKAARYIIRNGQLLLESGGQISTFEGIPEGTFAGSSTVENINTTFSVVGGKIVWSNPAFNGGVAGLYQTPDGFSDPAHIVARFYGTPESGNIRIRLVARPVNAATEGTVPPPGMSSTAMMSSIGGGMSSVRPPMPTSAFQTPGYTDQPSTGGQGGQNSVTTGQGSFPASSPAQSLPTASTSALPTSPDGICGGDSGFYCLGDDCCGRYGYCGTGADYCGMGCQPDFGTCWSVATSSMGMASDVAPTSYPPGISIPSAESPTSMSMTPPTSSSNGGGGGGGVVTTTTPDEPAVTYAQCPADDAEVVTDSNGVQYTIGCSRDTTTGSHASQPVSGGFNDCFNLCDVRADCMAFSYVGGVNGAGAGTCYLKNSMVDFVDYGERAVSGIRVMSPSGGISSGGSPSSSTPNYSTYTATATPIRPENPGGLEIRTSTTSTMSSMPMSMSMSMSMSDMPDMTSSVMPSSTLVSSPNGHCGTQGNGGSPEAYTCLGSAFGACCSLSGYCGDSDSYCLAGCQSDFGECTAQNGNPITINGGCGMDWDNQTCTGGIFGPCCSTSGYCGSTEEYCTVEVCDPMFGTCDEASSMSGAMSSTSTVMLTSTGMMATSASTTSMMASTTSPSAANPTASSMCPAANGTTYNDPDGNTYLILCARVFTPDSYSILPALSLEACIDLCLNQDEDCVGVTFGLGQCYLKDSYGGSSEDTAGLDSAVLISIMSPSTSSSSAAMLVSSTSSSMSVSSPSSSMAMSSSSSSMMSSSSSPAASSSPASSPPEAPTTTTTTTSTAGTTTTTTSMTSLSSPAITTTTTSTTRTTTTTTSTTSSSSSSAYLVLPSPTPCDFGDPVGYDEDDSYCKITLPFSMRMYTQSDANTFAATNGFLSLTYGSSQYASQQFPAANLPNNTVAPYFDDLYLDADALPKQGIFYQVQGTAVTYEWFLGRGGVAGRYYHFTCRYDSALPGVFTYTYHESGGPNDQGEYASVGAQGKNAAGASVGTTYAYHVQSIAPGLVVVCDTNANTCVTQS